MSCLFEFTVWAPSLQSGFPEFDPDSRRTLQGGCVNSVNASMIDIRVSQMCSTDTSYSSLSARIFGVYHSLINPRRPLNKICTKCSDFRLKFKEKSYLSNALMNSDIELHSSKVDDASFSRVYGIWHKHPLSAVR